MLNAKCKMLYDEYATQLEVKVNQFLQTIDIRQIVKIDYMATGENYKKVYCSIIYVDIEDIREAKIESILKT